MGDGKWQVAADIKMKQANYSKNLRDMNKKYGLMNLNAKTKEIGSGDYQKQLKI